MNIKFDDKVSVEELFHLLEEMDKFKGDRFPARNVFHTSLRDEAKEAESLKNTIAITARDTDGTLIGYIRLLTDKAYMFYILDVMVHPDYRKQGIGEAMMEVTVEESKKNGFIKIFLTAIPGSEPFYAKFGFKEGMSPVLTMRGEDYV